MGYLRRYNYDLRQGPQRSRGIGFVRLGLIGLLVAGGGYFGFRYFAPKSVEQAVQQLQLDDSLSETEKQMILDAMTTQNKSYRGDLSVKAETSLTSDGAATVLMAYVPVTSAYSPRQQINKDELSNVTLLLPETINETQKKAFAQQLGVEPGTLQAFKDQGENISAEWVAWIPATELSSEVKLLRFEDTYYLDSFRAGAVFRRAVFSGLDAASMQDLALNQLPQKDQTAKVTMTGVTALTRVMMKKLATVKDPLYFSEKIGDFLADADITHVSNEVSFRDGCQYSNVSFCSPTEFIETLKDSGVDVVELTGNHNNDNGNTYNTDSIALYRSLGMATVGGGLNREDAAKAYETNVKGNKLTILGYNMADGQGSGAIAGDTTAGANYYTDSKAKEDIEAAKQNGSFVIVTIQYAECQAYPEGYVEYPLCDGTIGGQAAAFRKMIDFGADLVMGSSAHQPQTYEFYDKKPIYYGLGNLYFDQTQWPGTERGIVLTHYFAGNTLLQTKLSPTVYDKDLQTRLMDNEDAVYLLTRLIAAR